MAFRIDTREFDSTLRLYMPHARRDWATILNTKGYYIARRATVTTKKADPREIRSLRERAVIGTGLRFRKGQARQVTVREELSSTRAARILQAERRAAGKTFIPRAELPQAVKRFIAARLRSIAYIKSGWIPAIRRLEPLARGPGRPRQDTSAKQIGRPKGDANPARPGWRTSCQISNSAWTRKSGGAGLRKFGQAGLQAAFNDEIRSMREYIERKMIDRLKHIGIRFR